MPRVSEAHLAARRGQILDAARACFLRNGFHATSMQDVIAEAGLSVGAVYRYFRGKSEIIAAIADQYATPISATLAQLTADEDRSVVEVMETAVDLVKGNAGPDGVIRIAVQVWAEAQRDEAVGAIASAVYGRLRGNFVALAERAVRTGELPPDADPRATGAALFSLVVGYALQLLLTGGPNPDAYKRGVRELLGRAAP